MEVDSAANSAREITDKAAAEDAVAAEEADDRKDLEGESFVLFLDCSK